MQLAMELDAAAVRANAAILAVAAKAERKNAGWVELALAELGEYARAATGAFTIEQARAAIEDKVPKPHDRRAWGQVTRMARAKGVIVQQEGYAPAASSNGSPKPLYRAGNA